MILVSACLLGFKTKYNGDGNTNQILKEYDERGQFLAVCPECLGHLPIPRLPSEIRNGDGEAVLKQRAVVYNKNNEDITAHFILGAEKLIKFVQADKIKYAILKERSPSCGVNRIYDGTFSGNTIVGSGVCTALLKQYGVEVFSEEEITRGRLEMILRR